MCYTVIIPLLQWFKFNSTDCFFLNCFSMAFRAVKLLDIRQGLSSSPISSIVSKLMCLRDIVGVLAVVCFVKLVECTLGQRLIIQH